MKEKYGHKGKLFFTDIKDMFDSSEYKDNLKFYDGVFYDKF